MYVAPSYAIDTVVPDLEMSHVEFLGKFAG
jgi:hypothetical protein